MSRFIPLLDPTHFPSYCECLRLFFFCMVFEILVLLVTL